MHIFLFYNKSYKIIFFFFRSFFFVSSRNILLFLTFFVEINTLDNFLFHLVYQTSKSRTLESDGDKDFRFYFIHLQSFYRRYEANTVSISLLFKNLLRIRYTFGYKKQSSFDLNWILFWTYLICPYKLIKY